MSVTAQRGRNVTEDRRAEQDDLDANQNDAKHMKEGDGRLHGLRPTYQWRCLSRLSGMRISDHAGRASASQQGHHDEPNQEAWKAEEIRNCALRLKRPAELIDPLTDDLRGNWESQIDVYSHANPHGREHCVDDCRSHQKMPKDTAQLGRYERCGLRVW